MSTSTTTESASNGKRRPDWERLLADIEAGKIDAVAAWDQDRVNRMMDDFIATRSCSSERGILLATSNNGDIDLSHAVRGADGDDQDGRLRA